MLYSSSKIVINYVMKEKIKLWEELKMKLNDTIETKETEETRGAIAKVEEKVVVPKPAIPKKPVAAAPAITEENVDKLIPQWKAQYGKIFKNEIDDDAYVIWRPIKRKEYKELLNADEEVEILAKQEAISKMAILYPANADDLIASRAGLATVLSEEILKYSGFEISATQSL